MVDYTDYEGWLEETLFDAIVILRKENWLSNKFARALLFSALDRISVAASNLQTHLSESWPEADGVKTK